MQKLGERAYGSPSTHESNLDCSPYHLFCEPVLPRQNLRFQFASHLEPVVKIMFLKNPYFAG